MSSLLPVDRDSKTITPTIVKLKIHAFVSQKEIIAKAAVTIDETNTILLSLIG